MVIVTVTEDNSIDGRQVNAKSFGVLHNCVRLPCVEQEFMLLCLDIDA